ncbi:uncharacterized protein LOC126634631 [Malus sylvestris]|uniref:uncharacterized protein LOC126634631 n=1 Tax=Malus sylvestris TaxID=3752 RepID=UPI0021AC00C3|nr:uncharacterized protein LOC126634631 [Malus sylvestris]
MLNLRINRNTITIWVNWLITLTNSSLNSKVEVDRVFSARAFHEASRATVLNSSLAKLAAQVPAPWSLPPPLFVKLNVDASWEQDTKLGFSGVVVRDSSGTFITAKRSSIVAQSAAVADVIAICHGCEMGVAMGFNFVVIESDSQDSISCLKGKISNGRWEAFPVLTKCKLLGDSFQDCRWSWTPRLANMAADSLASRRNKEMCDFTWVDRPPSSLVHVLCNDGLPCPP